ncbi:MAG: type I methionyl aminopeptidase [Pirellulaceae bacterium]|nr:type I methionyl aminopeptidase [Pirellulaceae bacterium]
MRRAGLVVWQAHEAAARLIRPGVTTGELDAAVEAVFQRYDATPLFKGVPGKIPFPAATCVSVNEEVVHGIPGKRVLKEGDIVSLDTGCRVGGWCGDAARTHAVGTVVPEVQRLLDVTRGTLELAIELLPKQALWSEVAERLARFVRESGFSVVDQFVGHGIGRDMHEPPQVPNFCNATTRRNDFRLRPGLVLAIEPMVNMGKKQVVGRSDHWTQVTADGKPSAHFEHTVALTSSGCQVLTGPPVTDEEHGWLNEARAAP